MLRFRLRTLLIAVAVLAVPMAWAGYSRRWIEERWTFRMGPNAYCSGYAYGHDNWDAPGCLWLFGELGYSSMGLREPASDAQIAEAKRLFPEARLYAGSLKNRRWL